MIAALMVRFPSPKDAVWCEDEGSFWRALFFYEGRCIFILGSELLNAEAETITVAVKRYGMIHHGYVSYEKAVQMIEQRAAIFMNEHLILKLMDRVYMRTYIQKRDHRTCRYCHQSFDQMTVDHLLPRSLGGISSPMNCVSACPPCNVLKSSMDMELYVATHQKFHPIRDWIYDDPDDLTAFYQKQGTLLTI